MTHRITYAKFAHHHAKTAQHQQQLAPPVSLAIFFLQTIVLQPALKVITVTHLKENVNLVIVLVQLVQKQQQTAAAARFPIF